MPQRVHDDDEKEDCDGEGGGDCMGGRAVGQWVRMGMSSLVVISMIAM